jgi:predicted metal-binding protein
MMTDPRSAGAVAPRPSGRSAKTKLTEVVVVCSKCAKRQGLRVRTVRERLKKAGKRAAADAKSGSRRKLCIVESGCLGPCPKRAVAVATGASLAAGRVLLLDPDSSPQEALAAILDPALPPAPSTDPARRSVPEFGPITALAAVPSDESPPIR